MSAVTAPSPSDAGPSSLPDLTELIKQSAKRTRLVYGYEGEGIDEGLAKAYV
jgi:pleiotropic regulator 1